MLIRNIDAPRMCNGTRLIVKKLMQHVIQAIVLTGCAKGEDVLIARIQGCLNCIPSDNTIQFKRIQFPLKLCFAMTINKSQGQSLGIAGIDLQTPMLFSWAVVCGLLQSGQRGKSFCTHSKWNCQKCCLSLCLKIVPFALYPFIAGK
ncbi:ATP-dependent DNA helicase [Trichonephila clavata]|uniref:ATP-dependent DNA helicase n=1 Tax=Trichonephila clavata TaxID=2740835 RepID=A0A8X6GEL0_TRICU|nr:ATP-dependent DNA helicase [Trichonephila clavata]